MTYKDEQEAIRAWLRAALEYSGMSQAELGRQVWADDRSVPNKILLGRRKVQVHELKAVEAATGFAPFDEWASSSPTQKIELPPRPSRKFHIKAWREHSEWEVHDFAKVIGVDEATYEFLETYPHKFTIEQIELIAKKLKIDFDTLRFEPSKEKPRPAPPSRPTPPAAAKKARGR